jgi:regulation of enolase protein 1 (concanavalin A-like superfamily)
VISSTLKSASWLNEPPRWSLDAEGLDIETGAETDFWQQTLYGFHRDSGHALLVPVHGDFTATAAFTGQYETLYDQAGLMLRVNDRQWIKAGVEFSDGVMNMSVVVTRTVSDWSTCAVPDARDAQKIRLTRKGDAVVVQFRNGNNRWQLLRVADFAAQGPLSIGPTACSPQRAGFAARFHSFEIGPCIDALHDETPVD